jgi:hypothetical protein
MTRISAPIFEFGGSNQLPARDSYTRPDAPLGMLALTGPSVEAEEGHLPVRGDLAHIKLAGRYFVPHYAVPVAYAVKSAGTTLRKAAGQDGEAICQLAPGTAFDVLDIAGEWAWGQLSEAEHGENGPVGYVALNEIESAGQ